MRSRLCSTSTIRTTSPRPSPSVKPTPTPTPSNRRFYRDYIRTVSISPSTSASSSSPSTPQIRKGRIPLRSNSTHGASSTRGIRPSQEDTFSVSCVSLPHKQLKNSYERSKSRISKEVVREWAGDKLRGIKGEGDGEGKVGFSVEEAEELAGQIAWFGCFDGHGGSKISTFLSQTLHQTFESVTPQMVTDTVQYTRSHGGYFRRFNGGLLERWVVKDELKALRGGRGNPVGREKLLQKEREKGEIPKSLEELGKSIGEDPDGDLIHGRGEDAFKAEKVALEGIESEEKKKVEVEDEVGEKKLEKEMKKEKVKQNSFSGPAVGIEAQKAREQQKGENKKEETQLKEEAREVLENLTKKIEVPKGMEEDSLTIAERATLACLVADRQIQADENLNVGGSTASVALIHSLDTPPQPWYSSKIISITSVHIGDTRMLLCPVSDGIATPLTNYHHPDDRAESERLRKMGAGMITDSFGEARWMGALANTRAFGDSQYKKLGVTAEPEIVSQILKGDDYAFIISFSDGIGGVLSDQEIVDLCRGAKHPSDATKAVLNFAEELGSDDNCTVLCIPLKGWGKVAGNDSTKEEREKRRSRVDVFRDNRQ